MHSPLEPFPRVTVPDEAAERITYFAKMAADTEALKPGRVSSIRTPDGYTQSETPSEFVNRVVTAAVLHVIEIGLLVIPDDLDERLDDYLPLSRDDGAWREPHGAPG